MSNRLGLPISYDDFRELRENNLYYVDKSLFIRDFIRDSAKVVLVTRPRRFGKTLNMTMLRDFFDITQDSHAIFHDLSIMKTEYAECINTVPVICFSFKDCDGTDPQDLAVKLCNTLVGEYIRYYAVAAKHRDSIPQFSYFEKLYGKILGREASLSELAGSIPLLLEVVHQAYGKTPYLFLDEYDAPILAGYEYGHRDKVLGFFTSFYGSALKGQAHLRKALLTGIQRIAKESIFSKLNNITVYTVLKGAYAPYFGLTASETKGLLSAFGLELTEEVRLAYNGYLIGGEQVYNPWSIINYCKEGELVSYWVKTSSNSLIRKCLDSNIAGFQTKMNELFEHGETVVALNLETSFSELQSSSTLWGLFVNAGYLTVRECTPSGLAVVMIPNREVKEEFRDIVAGHVGTEEGNFHRMTDALSGGDYETFGRIYKAIVRDCVSSFDVQKNSARYENPYHMLTLGMMLSLDFLYDIKSNYEAGDGRVDIRMISRQPWKRAHIVIEFKRDADIRRGARTALEQIRKYRYTEDLLDMVARDGGQVLCMGIAHDSKKCEIETETLDLSCWNQYLRTKCCDAKSAPKC